MRRSLLAPILVSLAVIAAAACGGDNTLPTDTGSAPTTTVAPDNGSPDTSPATTGTPETPGFVGIDLGLFAPLPPASYVGPACNPSPGGRIAFERTTIGSETEVQTGWQIVVVDSSGEEITVLLAADDQGWEDVGDPVWSPDGMRLAASTFLGDSGQALLVVGCDGTVEVTMDYLAQRTASPWGVPIGQASYPSWSPDGSVIAFASTDGLFLIDPSGVEQPYVVPLPLLVARGRPAWSPDGGSLAVAITPPIDDTATIVVVPLAGGPIVSLTDGTANDFQPAWSPDGATIAFRSNREGIRVWLMGADGSNQRPLTPEGIEASMPAWSPDGSQIVYVAGPKGDTRLRTIGVDGSNDRPLTAESGPAHFEGMPTWAP